MNSKKNISIAVLLFVLIIGIGWFWKNQSSDIQAKDNSFETANSISNEQPFADFELPEEFYFAGERLPLELFHVYESLERELIVNTYWHSSTWLLLKRANRWLPVIEPILQAQNMPDDLKYLCMIESNLTNARSPAGAVGFWQFMEGTAKEYGLELNKDVDERYHVEKATLAACKYFKKAYDKYGSWSLVGAAYNAGMARIDGFLKTQNASSYFDLLMAEETERYLYRMIALKIILNNPEYYGFPVDESKLYQPLNFEVVRVDETIPNLADFAAQYGISYKLLKYFNPWLRSNQLPVSTGKYYEVKIPKEPFNKTFNPY